MKQSEMAALLGRRLTPSEVTNFTLYLKTANELLENVLCYNPCSKTEVRSFKAREGYSTIFTGAFSYASNVMVNGSAVAATPQLWDKMNARWYNSLVFPSKLQKGDIIAVTAQWGFSSMPGDLELLLSKYFDMVSSGLKGDEAIQTKRVEDFYVTYANADMSKADVIATNNADTISKYSVCNIANVQHGNVCATHGVYGCAYCF